MLRYIDSRRTPRFSTLHSPLELHGYYRGIVEEISQLPENIPKSKIGQILHKRLLTSKWSPHQRAERAADVGDIELIQGHLHAGCLANRLLRTHKASLPCLRHKAAGRDERPT